MAKEKPERVLTALDKMVARALGETVPLGTPLDPVRESCPNVWACLSTTAAGEDHLMTPSRLSLSLTPGGVIVALSSQALAFSLSTSCVLLVEAFQAMETCLTGPAPPFQLWDGKETKLRKKRQVS